MSPFPFMVGCRRSGLSLLRAMFTCHPLVAVPPEASFAVGTAAPNTWTSGAPYAPRQFVEDLCASDDIRRWRLPRADIELSFREEPPATHADAVRRVYDLWARRQGKNRVVDISTANNLRIDSLARALPEARIIHLIRDGRNVGASLLEHGWVASLDDAALHWRNQVRTIRRSLRRLPPDRYHELRYEDLVRTPEATLRALCDAVDLAYHPAMLDYRTTATTLVRQSPRPHHHRFLAHPLMPNLRDWQRDLPPRAVDRFDVLAGDMLVELGYELRTTRRPLRAHLAATVRRPRWRRRVSL